MTKITSALTLLTSICLIFFNICGAFAFEDNNLERFEPADLDFVVLQNKQSKTVTADLSSTFDFGIIPVTLVGSGNFSASLSRTNTTGELVYLYLKVLYGFGNHAWDLNFSLTPITLRVSSTISDDADLNVVYVLIMHGILFSAEEPPYTYNITLSY